MVIAFWVSQFIFSWGAWFLLAKKGRWREYLPVCIFASYFSLVIEAIVHYFNLWTYSGHPLLSLFTNGFGVYIVVMYLFIQWLPRERTFKSMFKYWFIWTAVAIIFEWVHIWLGYMTYQKWWNIGYSYLSDWLLFWLFYQYHVFVNGRRN